MCVCVCVRVVCVRSKGELREDEREEEGRMRGGGTEAVNGQRKVWGTCKSFILM